MGIYVYLLYTTKSQDIEREGVGVIISFIKVFEGCINE